MREGHDAERKRGCGGRRQYKWRTGRAAMDDWGANGSPGEAAVDNSGVGSVPGVDRGSMTKTHR